MSNNIAEHENMFKCKMFNMMSDFVHTVWKKLSTTTTFEEKLKSALFLIIFLFLQD